MPGITPAISIRPNCCRMRRATALREDPKAIRMLISPPQGHCVSEQALVPITASSSARLAHSLYGVRGLDPVRSSEGSRNTAQGEKSSSPYKRIMKT